MQFHKTPIALAALAVCGSLPLSAQAAPSVSWVTPADGAVLKGTISGSGCSVNTSGATRVSFYATNWQINNDYGAPFTCNFDTTRLRDGAYTLRADAFDSSGNKTSRSINITIANNSTTPTTTNTAPSVSMTSPGSGQTVSGTVGYGASASDNAGVARVDFFLDGSSTRMLSDTSSPYGGSLNTTTLSNGAHSIRAVAYDAAGLSSSSSVSFNVSNTTTSTGGTSTGGTSTGGTSTGGTTTTGPVAFTSPVNNAIVRGTISGAACAAIAPTGTSRVSFYAGNWQINNDYGGPAWNCNFDTTRLRDGAYVLRADAFTSSGAKTSGSINITIDNANKLTGTTTGGTTTGTADTTAPSVSMTSPTSGQSVTAGTSLAYAANAADNVGVARVQFFLDNATTPMVSDTTSPYGGSLSTTGMSGTHTIKAVAFDAAGLSSSSSVTFSVATSTSTGGTSTGGTSTGGTSTGGTSTGGTSTGGTATGGTSSLPSTGTRAVTTFHSIGLYWTPGTVPSGAACKVQYRKVGDASFKPALDMWYDARNSECRGSIVQVQPNTSYEVQFALPGQSWSRGLVATTWNEQFPIAQTVTLPAGTQTQPLIITQGGSASGYVLYQAASTGTTIDVQNAYDNNVEIRAPYVIVRGLTLKGGRINGIELKPGSHDVVIENNDISGWGRFGSTLASPGWDIGVDMDAGIRARCTDFSLERVVVQRNKIHDPRYGSQSWDWGHPRGPQGITFSYCGGNNVFRYNEITSSNYQHYYNDGIGGEDNFTTTGFPNYDTDIYGNVIQGVMDDGIEAEGGDRNVRIWGNYLDQTGTGIASSVNAVGPLYIFRNVYNHSRFRYLTASGPDGDSDRGPFFKSGSQDSTVGDGRRYVFHNTALQDMPAGATAGRGAGGGLQGNGCTQYLSNTISRNNIFEVWKSSWESINQTSCGHDNDVNYDVYNGPLIAPSGSESSGIKTSSPNSVIYKAGNGPASGAGGMYQLDPSSPGFGKGVAIPNFNDGFSAPDIGAAQSGQPAMKFGVNQ